MPYPNLLAEGITAEDPFTPFQLFAGSSDVVTDQARAGAVDIVQFQVCIREADGDLVAWTVASGVKADCIAAQAIPAGAEGPVFTGGDFNHEALVWDAAADTLGERKNAFAGTNINVKKLL